MKEKIILCDGDSWTSGDIVDPEIFGDQLEHVNHPDNRSYRLPRVWPHKLGKLLGVDIENKSVAGSSNDAIVRRVVGDVIGLLKTYKSSEIFVIIGWTSPERKDFFFKGEWDGDFLESWETLYPAQYTQNLPNKEVEKFYDTYLKYFWHEEEYLNRYINQNLYLHYFLKSQGIRHMFFDAFYQSQNVDMFHNHDLLDDLREFQGNVLDEFLKIRREFFKSISFRRFLMGDNNKLDDDLFQDFHPSEKAHRLWAQELYEDLK
jgi:hypothetical protein|tara:strand:- start:306 stop:1088 length:783 start_codon:yes stop_codon:yes gene_type:complete